MPSPKRHDVGETNPEREMREHGDKQDRARLARRVQLKGRADVMVVGALLLAITVGGWIKVDGQSARVDEVESIQVKAKVQRQKLFAVDAVSKSQRRRLFRLVNDLRNLGLPSVGKVGASGTQGLAGLEGLTGNTGPSGQPGAKGTEGRTGAVGAGGAAGEDGAIGAQGSQGPAGPQGPVGATSATGADGAPCPNQATITPLEGPTVVCVP